MCECEWGRTDCLNQDKKCYLCITENQYYTPKAKPFMPKRRKANKRAGSQFEADNSNQNNRLLLGSMPTPNSGAGYIKGDEQIKGYIHIMEELKEQNKVSSKGEKTFNIHKEWLTKLHREAIASNQEFWYLKFIFAGADKDVYAILEEDVLMGMVKTMWEDRKYVHIYEEEANLAKKTKGSSCN